MTKPIRVDDGIRHSVSYMYGIELKTRTKNRDGKLVYGYNGVLYTNEYCLPIEYWERRAPYLTYCRELAATTLRSLLQSDGIDPIANKRVRDLVKGAKVKRIRLSVITETVTRANRSHEKTRRPRKHVRITNTGKTRR